MLLLWIYKMQFMSGALHFHSITLILFDKIKETAPVILSGKGQNV